MAKLTTKNQQHYLKPEIINGKEFLIFGVFSVLGSIHLSGRENFWCEDPKGQQRLETKLSCGVLDESLSDCEVSRGDRDILTTCTS